MLVAFISPCAPFSLLLQWSPVCVTRVVWVVEDASVVVKVSLVLKLWLGEFSLLVGRYSLAARCRWLVDGNWLLASLPTLP